MKNIYETPETEEIPVSLENGACIVASTSEEFERRDGEWA